VHLLSYVVKCTVKDSPFNTQANCSKCLSSVCLDTFPDSCDQRTYNLTKHCSVVDASCSAENSLEELFSRVHLVYIHHSFHVTPPHGNLMSSDPVTVVANSVHGHDQSIDLGVYDSYTALRPD